jgi:hypothetical protein
MQRRADDGQAVVSGVRDLPRIGAGANHLRPIRAILIDSASRHGRDRPAVENFFHDSLAASHREVLSDASGRARVRRGSRAQFDARRDVRKSPIKYGFLCC